MAASANISAAISFSAATMESGRPRSTVVQNRTIMRRLKSLMKAILKVPRRVIGKSRPKNRVHAPDDERKTDGLGEDDNELAPVTADDREGLATSAEEDRGENGDDGTAAEAGAAADSVPAPVVAHRALVKRGYTVNEPIGRGGYGSVLLARSKRHHGQMAIKVVEKLSGGLTDNSKLWSVINEMKFADLFDHPYLNVYHEVIDTSERTYMVMEYFPNGTLTDHCREVDFTAEPVAYEWFAQLCSALEYLHANGYSHRDVKLDNVLLDRQRRVRLADFGFCGAASATFLNGTVCGTPSYMSPELLARIPYHGQSADVWAAGVLLYCLVAGRHPFPLPDRADGRHFDKHQLVLESQRKGCSFNPVEKQRLSIECQSFFGHVFVKEEDRPEIKELKKYSWMIKQAQNSKK